MAISFSGKQIIKLKVKPTKEQLNSIMLFTNNLVLYNCLVITYREFLIKSKGESDSFGTVWQPLAESTRIYKSIKPGEFRKYKLHLWDKNRTATKGLTKKELLADREVPINIDTGRLLKAIKPNRFTNGRYIAGPDQIVTVTLRNIKFEVTVPYASAVDTVRPIWIEFEQALINEAVELSAPEVIKYVQRLGLD